MVTPTLLGGRWLVSHVAGRRAARVRGSKRKGWDGERRLLGQAEGFSSCLEGSGEEVVLSWQGSEGRTSSPETSDGLYETRARKERTADDDLIDNVRIRTSLGRYRSAAARTTRCPSGSRV